MASISNIHENLGYMPPTAPGIDTSFTLTSLPNEIYLHISSFLPSSAIAQLSLSCRSFRNLQNLAIFDSQLKREIEEDFHRYDSALIYLARLIAKSSEQIKTRFKEFQGKIEINKIKLSDYLKTNSLEYLKKFSILKDYIPLSSERAEFNKSFISFLDFLTQQGISIGNDAPYYLFELMHPTPYIDTSKTLFVSGGARVAGGGGKPPDPKKGLYGAGVKEDFGLNLDLTLYRPKPIIDDEFILRLKRMQENSFKIERIDHSLMIEAMKPIMEDINPPRSSHFCAFILRLVSRICEIARRMFKL